MARSSMRACSPKKMSKTKRRRLSFSDGRRLSFSDADDQVPKILQGEMGSESEVQFLLNNLDKFQKVWNEHQIRLRAAAEWKYKIRTLMSMRRLEEMKQKHKKVKASENLDFPGREEIKFGEVVKAPPKLVTIPKGFHLESLANKRLNLH